MEETDDRLYTFPKVTLTIEDFQFSGYILDIGGGGEDVTETGYGRKTIAG